MKSGSTFVCLALSLTAGTAAADDSMFKFSGFGTVGLIHSNDRGADYHTGYTQGDGAGASKTYNWDTDTKIAVQADAFLIPKRLTATVQVLSAKRYDDTFKPGLEWANLNFQATDQWYIRGGRVVAPTFMLSDTRSLGYSQTPIRPSVEVYSLNPITYVDGLDTGYKFDIGDATLSTQLTWGYFNTPMNAGSKINDGIHATLLSSTLEYNNLSVHVSGGHYSVTTQFAPFQEYSAAINALTALDVPDSAQIRNQTNTSAFGSNLFDIGFIYDSGKYLGQAEFARRTSDTMAFQNVNAWYMLGAIRLSKWTPYVSVAQRKTTTGTTLPSLSTAGLPAAEATELTPAIDGVNAFVQGSEVKSNQTTYSVGVKYDFYKNLDMKVQIDEVHKPSDSNGTFVNENSSFAGESRNTTLLSAAVDFVF